MRKDMGNPVGAWQPCRGGGMPAGAPSLRQKKLFLTTPYIFHRNTFRKFANFLVLTLNLKR
jgi:hypothetical protein